MAYVGFHDGSWCGVRVFSVVGDCLRVAQLILTVEHTRDLSGTLNRAHFRPAATTVENIWNHLAVRQTVGIHRNSSKTASHTLGTTLK